MYSSVEFRDSTSVHRSGMLPHHQMDGEHISCAGHDRPGSTNSAVGDASQDVFYLSSAQFCINGCNRGNATQCTVGPLEPADCPFLAAKVFIGNCHQARQS